jgi:hypothetical protein
MSDTLSVDAPVTDPLTVLATDPALTVEFGGDAIEVELVAVGIPGRDGVDGADGADGADGGAPVEWSPPSAQSVWIVAHNLDRRPSVTVALPDGEVVGCRVRHLDLNTVSIEFAAATSGTATLF